MLRLLNGLSAQAARDHGMLKASRRADRSPESGSDTYYTAHSLQMKMALDARNRKRSQQYQCACRAECCAEPAEDPLNDACEAARCGRRMMDDRRQGDEEDAGCIRIRIRVFGSGVGAGVAHDRSLACSAILALEGMGGEVVRNFDRLRTPHSA